MRTILFRHKRAWGDALMFTAGVRDFKHLFPEILINVDSNYPELWENNPYLDRTIRRGDPGVELYNVGYPTIQHSNLGYNHFIWAFLFDMIVLADGHKPLGMPIGEFCSAFSGGRSGDGDNFHEPGQSGKEPFLSWRKKYKDTTSTAFLKMPDIHLSDEEKNRNLVLDRYGISKYWVVAPGGKSDCTSKVWDWRKFKDVVDFYKGQITFVAIGKSDHIVEKVPGVISMVDELSLRQIFSLVAHAEGCISGVSFLMHCCAGLPIWRGNKPSFRPCVSIYGGREPTMFTSYEGHQVLHTVGALNCCDSGGCWTSRTVPLERKPEHNNNLCRNTVVDDGVRIQKCMSMIHPQDVIRAIGMYYMGDKFSLGNVEVKTQKKEINVLASLSSAGGGEQSAIKIVSMLRQHGWKVNLYPWENVHDNYKDIDIVDHNFHNGMASTMKPGLPLLFYGNDNVYDFCKSETSKEIVDKSSSLVVGINYTNGLIPKTGWIAKKTSAVIFQNAEKRDEFLRDSIGFEDAKKIVLYGAIEMDRFIDLPIRQTPENFTILKHCTPDYRKYVTSGSCGKGEKIHVWQKHLTKLSDVQFYSYLLDHIPGINFAFMEAHPEISEIFQTEPRMKFFKWNEIPVEEFLSMGHLYLYRTSNLWRDQYPRCVAEALAAGLPVLSEPRDGTMDRIVHGDTGFYCVDIDCYYRYINLMMGNNEYRVSMGRKAREWAISKLLPDRWVDVINAVAI
jgi:ADP-heptose:LPS heptosyltransferase